ncbi:MAG TPA: TIGR02186 family protein [Rhodospirillaceae bacterium]|nr:TIGR02186 family protein [Rhodospirillaceae bacterium]
MIVRLLLLLALFCPLTARAQGDPPLIVDLSNHLVAITTGFTGATVLLFGAVESEGDLVVVVRGPVQAEMVRRKEPVLGIWINRGKAILAEVPAYYQVAASRPLDEIAGPAVLDRHQIGLDHLAFLVRRKDRKQEDTDYRQALLRLKVAAGLYGAAVEPVSFVGRHLFRTEMTFPANVPTGTYSVEVYLMRRGEVVSAQTTPLIVSKIGVGAEVFDFANHQAALYGLSAVLLAVAAGWLGAVAFRRS